MKKLAIFMVLAFLLVLCAAPVYANGIPALPHAFYGSVSINGDPAPAGTSVEAKVEGVATGIPGNPITTTVPGIYGTSNPFEQRLIVQGDIEEGADITFYIDGVLTGQTYPFDSGEVTELPLSVTIAAQRYVGGGGGQAAPPTVDTTLFGIEGSFRISDEGEILATIEATSADGMLTITIPEGTIALDKDGNPLESLEAAVDESPPDPPEDAHIIGLAYDFGPDGATFEPAITLEYTYDPADIPEGVAEEDLVIAYYDEEAGEWVELPSTVDPVTHTITASVSHFTTFAIIGAVTPPAPAAFSVSDLGIEPTQVQPKEAVGITVSVANTGGMEGSYAVVLKINGVKEAEKSVIVAAGSSEIVTFSLTREEPGSYSVTVDGLSASFTIAAPAPPPPVKPAVVPPEVKPPINWPLIGGIIAAVVVVGLLIFFFVVRRRAY